MSELINSCLSLLFDEVDPISFYTDVFQGDLDVYREVPQERVGYAYHGTIVEMPGHGFKQYYRYNIYDDMNGIRRAISSNNFCITSPITYIGRNKTMQNARVLYGIVVDVDDLVIDTKTGEPTGLRTLIYQFSQNMPYLYPKPTYIVSSGSGVHLYYLFDRGYCNFKNFAMSLQRYKRFLTQKIWNGYVTNSKNKVQYQGIYQGFRVVGTRTKYGIINDCNDVVRAFKCGERVTIDYLNFFIPDDKNYDVYRITDGKNYKHTIPLDVCKKLYPDWYQRRIIDKEDKKYWICNEKLYQWWFNLIKSKATSGHRYHCVMCLAIYAIKCDIPFDALKRDAYSLIDFFESITPDDNNHFTSNDVDDALKIFNYKSFATFPANSIQYLSGIKFEKHKRNGRSREQHIKMLNAMRITKRDVLGEDEYKNNGRPVGKSKEKDIIHEWRKNNPNGRKCDCIKETGISKPTVYRWWDKCDPYADFDEVRKLFPDLFS